MADVKALLKEAKKLLVEEKNEEAMELCEKAIEEGTKEYMVYCFAALANANQEYPGDASTHYFEAIKLDPSKPTAWQGLFKLYDTLGLPIDDRAIETAEKVMEFAENNEKREQAKQKRREYLWYLRKFSILKDDVGTKTDFLKQVATYMLERENKNETEKTLMLNCLKALDDELWKDQKLHLAFVCYQVGISKSYVDWEPEVLKFIKAHPQPNDWIRQKVEFLLHVSILTNGALSDELFTYYVETYNENKDDFPFSLFDAVANEEWEDATDVILEIPDASFSAYPMPPSIFSAIRVFYDDESYEKCLRLIAIALPQVNAEPTIKDALLGYKASSLYNMKSVESFRLGRQICPLPAKFELIDALLRLNLGEQVDEGTLEESENKQRLSIHRFLLSKEPEKAIPYIEKLKVSESFEDQVLLSDILFATEQDPLPYLVKIARERPRCSRAFYLIAACLKQKNSNKAKSCAEQAVKIRPTDEEYVKLLDDILIQNDSAASERIAVLGNLRTRPNWAHQRLYTLFLEIGKVDDAIHSLQHLIRVSPDDASYWMTLGQVYLQRGSLQAAANAYLEASKLRPEGEYQIPMLHVLLRLGQYTQIVEKCDEWRRKNEDSMKSEVSQIAIDIVHAQALFQIGKNAIGSEQIAHLNKIFTILDGVLEKRPPYATIYKLAAEVLTFCVDFNWEVLKEMKIPESFSIKSPADCLKLAASMSCIVLSLDRSSSAAWADMGIILTRRAQIEKTGELALKAIDFLKQAIRLAGDNEMRSMYWVKLAEATRIAEKPPNQQQHCLIRALELNRSNAEAWCSLAILFGKTGFHFSELSKRSFESAMKVDPECAVTWTGYAFLALSDSHVEGRDRAIVEDLRKTAVESFLQALTYKPAMVTVENLSDLLALSEYSIDPTSSRVDFERVLALQDRDGCTDASILRLALLTEQFGYFEDNTKLLDRLKSFPLAKYHRIRTQLLQSKCGEEQIPAELAPLAELAGSKTEELYDKMTTRLKYYQEIFAKLPTGENLASLCRLAEPPIHVPLIIAYLLFKKMEVPKQTETALHNMRPRHQLLDVWPTELDEEMSDELKYLEEDGEEPFRLKHRLAKELYNRLFELRQKWFAERPPVEKKTKNC
ncbi:unnamed protein product, partial [Mesorhabditis belari]|uniref:Uncharacterized protein n=1 Tax=Mesorhabditis belari TaxID=2138241 RepID=A0AAF3ECN4_9BILA